MAADHLLEEGVDQTIAWVGANLEFMKTLSWDYAHKP
jgi:hypothetical protein